MTEFHTDYNADQDRTPAETTDGRDTGIDAVALLETHEMQQAMSSWKEIQARFVDDPRNALHDADMLVTDLVRRLAQGFASEREKLEAQWAGGKDVSTEDLRRSLQRYRAFFGRLLAA